MSAMFWAATLVASPHSPRITSASAALATSGQW